MLVSIIVPVFNSERYLHSCIDSLVHQTITDYEVILVNDGSNDNSGAICDEYSLKDSRIKVFHIPNGGVSNARNYGISNAKGDYVSFVDSDDYIDNDYVEQLISAIGESADIVMSGIVLFSEVCSTLSSDILDYGSYDMWQNSKDAFSIATMNTITSPVSKLYKKSIIDKNKIKFSTNQSYGEDREFNIDYLFYANTVVTIPYVGYHYRRGISSSLSQVNNPQLHLDIDLKYISKLQLFFDMKTVANYGNIYITNRLFHIFNDRLTQIVLSRKHSCSEIKAILDKYKCAEQYKMMLSNIKYVDSSSIVATLYRLHLACLVPYYYRVLSL